MIVHLIAIGNNMPNWVKDGFDEYQSRWNAKTVP